MAKADGHRTALTPREPPTAPQARWKKFILKLIRRKWQGYLYGWYNLNMFPSLQTQDFLWDFRIGTRQGC